MRCLPRHLLRPSAPPPCPASSTARDVKCHPTKRVPWLLLPSIATIANDVPVWWDTMRLEQQYPPWSSSLNKQTNSFLFLASRYGIMGLAGCHAWIIFGAVALYLICFFRGPWALIRYIIYHASYAIAMDCLAGSSIPRDNGVLYTTIHCIHTALYDVCANRS